MRIMALEMNAPDLFVCGRCGKGFGKRQGHFMASYAQLHRGTGFLPICYECVNALYEEYYNACGNSKDAVRQMCRKLDLFWSEKCYEAVINKASKRSMMTRYLAKVNSAYNAGKCYDDSLEAEGTLWSFVEDKDALSFSSQNDVGDLSDISDETMAYWGPGYSSEMYKQLEQRRQYWMSRIPDDVEIDIIAEATIKQICSLEIDINLSRAAGKNVDKSIGALNSLLGNSSMKKIIVNRPEGEDADLSKTPLGVWLYRYENERPLPEIDKEYKDVRGILKYVFTWMGHLCKMLGLKNGYTELYEAEIEKYRVEKPEYDSVDDEEFMSNIVFGGADNDAPG